MTARLLDLFIGFAAGVLLAGALTMVCADQRLQKVQAYADTVATSAAKITARANARADSARTRADSIARVQRPVLVRVERDTIAAAVAARSLAAARTVRDTNVALRLENLALRQAVGGLWVALEQERQISALERARGDSLRKALGDVNLQLQAVNARVQDLGPKPRWIAIGEKVVLVAAAAWVGYQVGRDEHANVAPTRTAMRCARRPYHGPC